MLTPDHIVIVIEENHDQDQIVGNQNASYINNTLINDGLYYSNAHGTDHPSQPNYLELFAGANPGVQGAGIDPNSPAVQNGGDHPKGELETTPILTFGATGTNTVTQQTGQMVPLNDPDSLKTAPNGDLLLSSGDDGTIIDVHDAGQADQSVSFTEIVDSSGNRIKGLDDVIKTDAKSGTFYLSDTTTNTIESFHVSNLNPNDYYASVSSLGGFGQVDPSTGQFQLLLAAPGAHGLAFVPDGGSGSGDHGHGDGSPGHDLSDLLFDSTGHGLPSGADPNSSGFGLNQITASAAGTGAPAFAQDFSSSASPLLDAFGRPSGLDGVVSGGGGAGPMLPPSQFTHALPDSSHHV
jgi:hypothetical protein